MAPHRIVQENKDIWNSTIYYSSAVTCPEAVLYQIVVFKSADLSSFWRCFVDLEAPNKVSSSS